MINMEIWKNYNERISVSDQGNVKRDGKLINFKSRQKYYAVNINKKPVRVHTLVWSLFGNSAQLKGEEINHLNGNRYDNRISNLECGSVSNNCNHAYKAGLKNWGERSPAAKLSDDDILLIRTIGRSVSQRYISKSFGISQQQVSRIINFKTRLNNSL